MWRGANASFRPRWNSRSTTSSTVTGSSASTRLFLSVSLASGLLTGKYNDGVPPDTRTTIEGYEWLRSRVAGEQVEETIAKLRQLAPIADELDCTMAQLAIAWCLANPNVSTVITGASRPEQVRENMKAIDVYERLTPEILEKIEGIIDNKPEQEPDLR